LVEDVGDFSVRGFIVDIFTPQYQLPVRIEQIGDHIESIRFFDPSTQRSDRELSDIIFGPVHPFMADEEDRELGIQRLMTVCDDGGVERRLRQRIIDECRRGVRFPGSDYMIPYFFPQLESLFDYLGHSTTLVLPGMESVETALEDLEEQIFRGREVALKEGLPLPSVEESYVSRRELRVKFEAFPRVIIGDLHIQGEGTDAMRISCSTNANVRRDIEQTKNYDAGMKSLCEKLNSWRDHGMETLIVSHTRGQANRLMNLLEPYRINFEFRGNGFDSRTLNWDFVPGIRLHVGELSSGFRLEDTGLVILTEEEIFGKRLRAPQRKKLGGAYLTSLTDLSEGDAVVHEDYGVGFFRGLARKEFDGIEGEVMVIEYLGGDLLYQPLDRLHVIQKYISASEGPPAIDRLGGRGWEKTKAKVKKSIREMASELLAIFARRQVAQRKPYSACDEDYAAFEAAFEFEETPDQARAIQDVMEAMDSDLPMDRLVCGDVGYGKTEVALRAAFRAIMDGKQVAILVPTTVLAQQHYETFRRRFSSYPIRVEVLSRFNTSKTQKHILAGLETGRVDLVVATHKLLGERVLFKDLGLLVIDEEHRFGVAHKEKIKRYKSQVDVLTLTATPIPRTLNLSLTGIRDLSLIETPPTNRKSIRTHVMRQSDEVIREAIERELNRGGQVFYLHNRVQSIYRRASLVKSLVPTAVVGVAHGQMANKDLEKVMVDFVLGKCNVLVCTSIVESGLDIPQVNTIIVERADTFGLADLYQLRGRVGRSNTRAYAYLLTPPETSMTPDAIKRLGVLQDHANLGQGFRIAMRDMEIRGAGNILGTSQSGHVAQVGYEMYLELLEEAVKEIKGEPSNPRIDPEIHLKVDAQVPEIYVPDPQQRMNLYKRLSKAVEASEIDDIEEEIVDLYGKPPLELIRLLEIMRIRTLMCRLRVSRVDYNGKDLVFTIEPDTPIDPLRMVEWVTTNGNSKLIGGDRLAYTLDGGTDDYRIEKCRSLLRLMSEDLLSSDLSSTRRMGETVVVEDRGKFGYRQHVN
jgi:transcription-repair coupling factor (superfamily II helicase)